MKHSLLPLALLALGLCGSDLAAQEKPATIDAAEFDTLQSAIDALPETGGLVKLPPGTTEISKPLLITTPETRIAGSGPSTHIKNINEEGEPAILIQPANRADDARVRLWRVELDSFRVSGNPKSGDGVRAEGINEILVHSVSIDHHGRHGLAMIDCYEDPRVTDSIFTYNKHAGLYIDANHDIVVNGNHFEENDDALVCVDSFNLCMNGNNIDDHLGNGVVIENTYGSVVSGNMIEECQGTAIILDRDCYGITLSANVIAHELEGGIDLRDAHGCAVSANTFVIVHKHGVRVGPDSGRITISANNFSNSYTGDGKTRRPANAKKPIQQDAGNGVVIEDAEHVTISGNTFSGMDAEAVRAAGECRGILVSGNLITDWGKRTGDKPVKAIAVPKEGNLVQGNLVDGK